MSSIVQILDIVSKVGILQEGTTGNRIRVKTRDGLLFTKWNFMPEISWNFSEISKTIFTFHTKFHTYTCIHDYILENFGKNTLI